MKILLKDLWILFSLFFYIGVVTIGGGYVMLPILRRELVEKRTWVKDRELLDYYAIGQATPGIIAINTATFVGYKKRGVLGAFAATLGMVLPSLIIITAIASFIPKMQQNSLFQKAFQGIRVSVSVLLLYTLSSLIKKSWKSFFEIILTLLAFIAVLVFKSSPVTVVIIAGITSFCFKQRRGSFK